jgi:hypothetical protein
MMMKKNCFFSFLTILLTRECISFAF